VHRQRRGRRDHPSDLLRRVYRVRLAAPVRRVRRPLRGFRECPVARQRRPVLLVLPARARPPVPRDPEHPAVRHRPAAPVNHRYRAVPAVRLLQLVQCLPEAQRRRGRPWVLRVRWHRPVQPRQQRRRLHDRPSVRGVLAVQRDPARPAARLVQRVRRQGRLRPCRSGRLHPARRDRQRARPGRVRGCCGCVPSHAITGDQSRVPLGTMGR
jgi:hypothetical protein